MSDKQKDKAQFTRKKIQAYSYGLHDQIGKGYSSKVYKGRNDDTNNPVAVKVIDLKQLKNQINRTLLDSEIQILKELKDLPNILNLYDVFTTKNNTYLVTQLCHSDVSKRIKKSLTQSQAFDYMQQIISGYIQFQKKNIVHRDLKPANLLMTEDGVIKIADFGFGIKTSQLGKSNRYNVGSPLYMAPQSLRKNDYSFKSDIWALGVIFYELLLNDTPWRAKSQKELLKRVESEPIQSIVANKNIPAIAKQFLVKTLKIDKNKRMTPEELQLFSFESGGNILAEKSLNNNTIRSQNFQPSSPPCKMTKRSQKSLEKQLTSGPSKPRCITKPLITNDSVNMFQFEHTKSIQSPSVTREDRTTKTNTIKNDAASRQNRKLVSKILITQVHFCRFLFKLMQKMKQSSKVGLLSQINGQVFSNLMKSYTGIIKYKIEQLGNFSTHNFINCQGYEDYKMTSDYEKLMKIAKQYNDRYRVQLQKYWSSDYSLSSEPTNNLIKQLYGILSEEAEKLDDQSQISQLSKDIVILDYLITAHQLIQMVRSNPSSYQRFARKSRIEEIVEGRTVEIHWVLFEQIMERVKHIMQKKQFMSFGCDQVQNNPLVMV